jgi:signal transduction histidine kinase
VRTAHWLQAAALAAVYFIAAKLSLQFAIPPGYATAVWPPSGIALAALALAGVRMWPGVWVGAALANATVETSWTVAGVIATGNTVEALVGAALIQRMLGAPSRFERGEDVLKFFAVAALAPVFAASIALVPLSLRHDLAGGELFWNWFTWWQGDATGIVIVAPLILAWARGAPTLWTRDRALECAALVILLFVTARLAFGAPHGSISFKFVIVPYIIWAAFRFGPREVTTIVALACGIAVWYTAENSARLGRIGTNESLLILLAFNSVVVLTGLVLSTVLAERARAMAELRGRHDELEARVRERTREVERANRAKSDFLATMSHELRTPLNSLLILAGMLRENPDRNLSAKQLQYVHTIHSSGSDLLALINEILDLARIESGAPLRLDYRTVRLTDVQGYVEQTFRQMAEERRVAFVVAIEGGLAEIRTDPRRLQQILKNLLANAFKFTRQGEVRLRMAPAAAGWPPGQPTLDRAVQVVAFEVADTGIGVAADKQEIIFQAFQQADATTGAEYGGTGLGLSISRELARLLGGEIALVSEPGRGSRFTLYLPAAPGPAVASAPSDAA